MAPRLVVTLVFLLFTAACTSGGSTSGASPTLSPPPAADPFYADAGPAGAHLGYVQGTDQTFPGTAFMRGDGWRTQLVSVQVTRELPVNVVSQVKQRPRTTALRAAPGHEFLVTRIGPGAGVRRDASVPLPGPYQVLVDGHVSTLDLTPLASDVFVVASVPTGADAQLRIVDQGKTSAISLRTGTPIDPEGCRAPLEGSENMNFVFGNPPVGTIEMDVDATQSAFVDGHGWAKPGHCWVTVTVASRYMVLRDYDPADPYGPTQPAGYSGLEGIVTSATVGGRPVRAGKPTELPESAKAVRLTVRPRDPRFHGSRVTWWNPDTEKTSDPATLTFTIDHEVES